MTSRKKNMPDFFEDSLFDPMETATGHAPRIPNEKSGRSPASGARPLQPRGRPTAGTVPKKKAGFYLSADILERFTRKFHELKLAGVAVENKSTLLESALTFALDDLDQGSGSRILKSIDS